MTSTTHSAYPGSHCESCQACPSSLHTTSSYNALEAQPEVLTKLPVLLLSTGPAQSLSLTHNFPGKLPNHVHTSTSSWKTQSIWIGTYILPHHFPPSPHLHYHHHLPPSLTLSLPSSSPPSSLQTPALHHHWHPNYHHHPHIIPPSSPLILPSPHHLTLTL